MSYATVILVLPPLQFNLCIKHVREILSDLMINLGNDTKLGRLVNELSESRFKVVSISYIDRHLKFIYNII